MRKLKKVIQALVLVSLVGMVWLLPSESKAKAATLHRASGNLFNNYKARKTAGTTNGFASQAGGTSGGAKADRQHTFVVHTRAELVMALTTNLDNAPRLIFVDGKINMNADANNNELTVQDYADRQYTFEKYLSTYSPEVWGRDKVPEGTVEEARHRSQINQAKQISAEIPANTTLYGIDHAQIKGGSFSIKSTNVIIRNISFISPYDLFPQWDPTDDVDGNWNSEYDSITVNGGSQVWLDHNSFSDGEQTDSKSGEYFGREYQHHDGCIDVVNGATNVTVSNNKIANHDKTMLIGNSNSKVTDRGKLHVTITGNLFDNIVQRQPRVRFGKVHVYNNYYHSSSQSEYVPEYVIGVGVESQALVQNNVVELPSTKLSVLAKDWGGKQLTMTNTLFNGRFIRDYGRKAGFSAVDWQPPYHYYLKAPFQVKQAALWLAGPKL